MIVFAMPFWSESRPGSSAFDSKIKTKLAFRFKKNKKISPIIELVNCLILDSFAAAAKLVPIAPPAVKIVKIQVFLH